QRPARQVDRPRWAAYRPTAPPEQRLRSLAGRAHAQPRLARAVGAARRPREPRPRHRSRSLPPPLRRVGAATALRHGLRLRVGPPRRVADRRSEPRERAARTVPVGVRGLLDRRAARGAEPRPRRGCRDPSVRLRRVAPPPHRSRHRAPQQREPPGGAQARPPAGRRGGTVPPDPRRVGGPRPLRDHVRGGGRAPRRDHEAVPPLNPGSPGRSRSFSTEDAYGLLLAIIILTFVVLSQVDPARWTRLVVAPSVGAMLLLALYASRARFELVRAAVIALAVSYLIVFAPALFSTQPFQPSIYLIYGLLLLITPLVIINRILRHPEVQVSTILGAICAYMLIGMVFGFVYALIGRIDPPFFAKHGPVD